MHSGKSPADVTAVPLQTAVLCVNCECVTSGRMDQCAVCGSRSLLSLARVIGGIPLAPPPAEREQQTTFNVEIAINWKEIQPSELSEAVESLTSLIGPWLVRGQASCHIDVAPVRQLRRAGGESAA